MRAEDPRAPDIDETAAALVPRSISDLPFDIIRFQQMQQVPVSKRPQPTVLAVGMFLVVVSFDRNYRDTGVLHQLKPGDSVVHRLGRDVTLVEKISADDHKIYELLNAVPPQNVDPRVKKISWTFMEVVSRTSEVDVRNVQETHLRILSQAFA